MSNEGAIEHDGQPPPQAEAGGTDGDVLQAVEQASSTNDGETTGVGEGGEGVGEGGEGGEGVGEGGGGGGGGLEWGTGAPPSSTEPKEGMLLPAEEDAPQEEVEEGEEEGMLTDINIQEAATAAPAPLFFADATLDLAEAQGIADTPSSSTSNVLSTLPPTAPAVPHMPFITATTTTPPPAPPPPPPPPPTTTRAESFIREGAPPGVESYGQELENVEGIAMTPITTPTTFTPLEGEAATTSTTTTTPREEKGGTTTEILDRPLRSIRADDYNAVSGALLLNGNVANGGTCASAAAAAPANRPTYRPRPPRRPRDAAWAVAAVVVIPLCFILPLHAKAPTETTTENSWVLLAVSSQGRTVTLLATLLAYCATLALGRILYRTMGGGDGDDGRHLATTLIVRSNIVSFLILPLLAIEIYYRAPRARGYCAVPLLFFVREFVLLRDRALAPRGGNEQVAASTSTSSTTGSNTTTPARGDATGLLAGDDGRTTFFQALACAALDILSRSLRRLSFYRVVSALLLLQWALLVLWRWALFSALAAAASSSSGGGKLLVVMALVGGKWATGIVTRILSLVASGGVTGWFAQQSILMDNMERMKAKHAAEQQAQQQEAEEGHKQKEGEGTATTTTTPLEQEADDSFHRAESIDTASDDYPMGYSNLYGNGTALSQDPAYRSADASAYSPVIDFDEGMDDDFDDEDDDVEDGRGHNNHIVSAQGRGGRGFVRGGMGGGGGRSRGMSSLSSPEWTGGGSGGGSTVKAFLWSAVTVSFGSVAQCGLVGGLALWLALLLRNVDALVARWTTTARRGGYRGMTIGGEGSSGVGWGLERLHGALATFCKSHSDLAMSHVAAYFKSFSRAANDVAALVDAAGVEPIVRDDITQHMCASVCLAIAGTLTFFLGYILSHHKTMEDSPRELSDAAVCQIMLVSYCLAYNLLFCLLEPLRASIKAVYVCFAQHPQSLSQAFPLIYHRLHRIAQANLGA